jgi:hypothetical protein
MHFVTPTISGNYEGTRDCINNHGQMMYTLLKMKKAVEQAGGALPEDEPSQWESGYDHILSRGRQELEAHGGSQTKDFGHVPARKRWAGVLCDS